MSLTYGLLGLVNYGEMTGYEISKVFEESLDFFWHAQSSQIYRHLDLLESQELLQSRIIIQKDKPNKRMYSITDKGKEEFHSWLNSPSKDIIDSMKIRSSFLMRVFFAGDLEDEQIIEMLKEFKKTSQECLLALDSTESAISNYSSFVDKADKRALFWKMSVTFGESYYQAEIEWADKIINLMEKK